MYKNRPAIPEEARGCIVPGGGHQNAVWATVTIVEPSAETNSNSGGSS